MQLQMLGYDVSWAAFNIIEVMSSPKFTHKVSTTITHLSSSSGSSGSSCCCRRRHS